MRAEGAGPLGSRLLGQDTDSPAVLRWRVQTLLTGSVVLANVIGALVVIALIAVIPGPSLFTHQLRLVDAVALPGYVAGALGVGVTVGTLRSLRALRWSMEGRAPTAADLRATLAVPARLTRLQAGLWLLAGALFTPLYGIQDSQNIPRVALTVLFGGLVVCGNSYLLTEFSLRPVAAKALTAGPPGRTRLAGVTSRSLLIWGVGSAIPVAGLLLVALFSLTRGNVSASRLAITVLALSGVTLAFGLLLTWLGISATVAPIRLVRAGLADVEAGRLDSRVVVFDGTELGELQAGFNRMAQGLTEREQLRDLFGRHVGRDVAAAALVSTPRLGGEEREVAVFFIDLIGSTALAARRPPAEVVALLNRFFSVVVDEVEDHHGFINKFEGDGALAVFGAPAELTDPAGRALAAARRVDERLRAELPEADAAIGVAAGRAVAGNVGHERRFEYTVIGDPVNEAARLAELAKTVPGHLVASAAAVDAADPAERAHWRTGESVLLRGRAQPTTLAVPS